MTKIFKGHIIIERVVCYVGIIIGLVLMALMSDQNLTDHILIAKIYIYLSQFAFVIVCTSMTFFLTKKYQLDLSLANNFFFNLLFLGNILVYSFLQTNQRFHTDQSRKVKVQVLEYGKAGSKTQRHVGVNACIAIDNLNKKIWFPDGTKLQGVKELELTIAQGYWGYGVIIDHKILQ